MNNKMNHAALIADLSGLPYRTKARELPGSPDLVFDAVRLVVFVKSCRIHRHDCPAGKKRITNESFWKKKMIVEKDRVLDARRRLRGMGWIVVELWECEL